MRRQLIAANWKMHGSVARTQEYLEAFVGRIGGGGPEVVVCPPFTALPAAVMVAGGSAVGVGAQNCHWEEEGAFTAEIAPSMLVELGVQWVITGHSERRKLFGETDESAARRAAAAQRAGLSVIFCLGESLEEREGDRTFDVLRRQAAVLGDLGPRGVAVAYEPVWAIGTGRNATPEQAQEAHAFLRERLADAWGRNHADATRIVYGGSVKPDNAASLLTQPDVDGALVGGASLDVESFSAIIQSAPGA